MADAHSTSRRPRPYHVVGVVLGAFVFGGALRAVVHRGARRRAPSAVERARWGEPARDANVAELTPGPEEVADAPEEPADGGGGVGAEDGVGDGLRDGLRDVLRDSVESEDARVEGVTIDDFLHPSDASAHLDGSTYDPSTLFSLVPIGATGPGRTAPSQAAIEAARGYFGRGPAHINQGNPAISRHLVSHEQCIAGLRGLVLQTKEQKAICGGDLEVPIHRGDPGAATACIDVFEYPNRPCELPFVYSWALQAERLCALDGKRLCTQEEWNTACEAGEHGEPPRTYAYGDALDLEVCNTGKPHDVPGAPACDTENDKVWATCATNTEPSGSFPRCRSRLGVFDQHGNVAEAMTRREDHTNWIQLKGSAFFYDGVMYRDHCRFDPRWHVDKVTESFHSNYHLGFRCCRTVTPWEERISK